MGNFGYLFSPNSLTFTVEDLSVMADTDGRVEFDGFTGGQGFRVYGANPVTQEVNGVEFVLDTGSNPNGISGLELTSSLTIQTINSNGGGPVFRACDFQISYYTNAAPVYIGQKINIDFLGSEGYSDGLIGGQGWNDPSNGWTVATAVPGTASATNVNVNMTLTNRYSEMPEGQTISFEVDFKFLGEPEDLSSGGVNFFNGYWFNIGLSTSNSGAFVGSSQYYAEASRFQRYYLASATNHFVRLGQNSFDPFVATSPMADIAEDDNLCMKYVITLGDSVASSTVAVTLTNKTQMIGESGSYAMNSTNVYEALIGSDGVYFYIETASLTNETGLNSIDGVQVDRVTITVPVLSSGDLYNDWASLYGLSGNDAEPDADPDGDGLNNLGEYGLNGDPNDDQNRGHITYVVSGGSSDYAHAALLMDSTVTYTVETAEDLILGPWIPITADGTNTLVETEYEEWAYTVDSTPTKKFIRITIER